MTVVSMAEISGKRSCIDPTAAEPVFSTILGLLRKNEKVTLSFKGIERVITAFLSVAVGKLCDPKNIEEEKLDNLLTISDATEEQKEKFSQVMQYAKMHYKEPDRLNRIVSEE